MQRVALINGKNKNQDYDLSKIFSSIATSGIVDGLEVQNGKVTSGYAFIEVDRAGTKFNVLFQNTEDLVIDTTGTKKVFIEINQSNIDDGTINSSDGTGIGEIKIASSYPTKNFIALASITSGVITDARSFVKFRGNQVGGDLDFIGGTEPKINGAGLNKINGLVQLGGDGKIDSNLLNSPIVDSTKSTFIAGENITAGNALYISDYDTVVGNTPTAGGSVNYFGDTTYYKQAQSFTVASNYTNISKIELSPYKNGSPTDNVVIRIETDNDGSPSGTLADANATLTITSGELTTSEVIITKTFTPFNLNTGTYWIVYSRSSTLDNTNRYALRRNTPDYAGGTVKAYNGSAWALIDSPELKDTYFKIYQTSGKAYKTDPTTLSKTGFVGFANNTVVTGGTVYIDTAGVNTKQSGMTIGSTYFLGLGSYLLNERKQLAQDSAYMLVNSTIPTTNGKTVCQSFTLDQTVVVSKLLMAFTGSGGLSNWKSVIRVETDNAGTPSGTLVNANSYMSQSNTGTIDFPGSFTLTKNTKYWITVYSVNISSNAQEIKNVLYTNTNVFAGEVMGYYMNTSYNNFTRTGSLIPITGTLYFTFTVASFPEYPNASALTSTGNTQDSFTGGLGIISLTPVTTIVPVGKAISTTGIDINIDRVKQLSEITPTVGVSPYTYQNTTGRPVLVSITGGTVSQVAYSRDNTNYYQTSATTNTFVYLGINDYVKVTYSVVPVLKTFTF